MKMKEGLLMKYLNGNCSKKQVAKVQSWLAEDIAHSNELDRLKVVWSQFEDLKSFKTPNIKKDWKTMTSLVDFHGIPKNDDLSPKVVEIQSSMKKVAFAPKPIVTDQVSTIDNEDVSKSSVVRSSEATKMSEPSIKSETIKSTYVAGKKNDSGIPLIDKIVYIVGSIIAAGIIAFGIYKLLNKKTPIVEIATTETSKEFTLPDGSEVVLDPFSRLSYPRDMDDQRRLSLFGGGEFDVMADTEPMIVDYGDVSVMTRGTSFDLEKAEDFVSAESFDGKLRFFETLNEENNVELSEGDKFKYVDGNFESMILPVEVLPELPVIIVGESIKLDRLLDWLMEESGWKVITTPSMPIDRDHEVVVNLDQSYEDVLSSLKDLMDIDYQSAECNGCYLIKRMKSL